MVIVGKGYFWVNFQFSLIEADEPELPLFTELKKLDLLSRYRALNVAKMAVFHS